MTQLGKAFVFINLVFSFMIAVWAYGLYSTRVDWTASPAKADQPPGELTRRTERIKALGESLRAAEASWLQNRARLAFLEARRPADRRWYEAELLALRANPRGKPVPETQVTEGQVVLDDQGRPKLAPALDPFGKALLSFVGYGEEEEDVLAAIAQEHKRLDALVREDQRLTNLLAGEPPDGKGLHERIREERAKIGDVLAEQKLVEPLLVNATVERDIVGRRERVLQARVEELKKEGVARAGSR